MKTISIKMKVTLWYTGLFISLLAVLFAVVYITTGKVVRINLEKHLEAEVYENARDVGYQRGSFDLDNINPVDHGVRISVYNDHGVLVGGTVPKNFPNLNFQDQVIQSVKIEQQDWAVFDFYFLAQGSEQQYYWVRGVISRSDSGEIGRQVIVSCALFFPLLALVAGFGGYWITKKSFQPVVKINEAAAKISNGGDLSRRIELKGDVKDEIYELAQTFDHMFKRLESSFDKERQFTSDASHELRTPISVIIAEAEYGLAQQTKPAKMVDSMQTILQQGKKMSQLIANLLLLSRVDNAKERMLFEKVDFSELTKFVLEEMRLEAEKKSINIESFIEPDIFIKADQTSLMRILINLISNAIKYGKVNGWIKISVYRQDSYIIGSIEDNGIGIAMENLPKIWNRFYQVNTARSAGDEHGTGLGLAMVKWMIEYHGGTITVDSKLGQGSTFVFRLPIEPEPCLKQ